MDGWYLFGTHHVKFTQKKREEKPTLSSEQCIFTTFFQFKRPIQFFIFFYFTK
jgi:hypothetical protein